MIIDMDPIAYVLAVAVNREGFIQQRLHDHEGNQLLRKLIWAVVVRAAGDDYLLPMGLEGSEREKIRSGFARGVRRARIEQRLFGKLSRRRQRTVKFVRRNLNE